MTIFYENKRSEKPAYLNFNKLKTSLLQTDVILPLLYNRSQTDASFVPFFNERTTTGKLINETYCHSRV